jgi:hypothetical protein
LRLSCPWCARCAEEVIVAPLEVPRNAERAQSEGRAMEWRPKKRGQGHYKGRSSKAPARTGVLEEPQYEQHHNDYYHNDYHRADHPSPPPPYGFPQGMVTERLQSRRLWAKRRPH